MDTPSTPAPSSKTHQLPPDTIPVQRFASQSDYRTGDLSLGRKAVLQDLQRYLSVTYDALFSSAFGVSHDITKIREELTETKILNAPPDGRAAWAAFKTGPSQSNASEAAAFKPLTKIISSIFAQIPNCILSVSANPSITPLSDRNNTSRPDAFIAREDPATQVHWFNIAIPFEFKKTNDRNAKFDNEQKIIWSLHNIMREDPTRRFALGITIEDTDLRIWYTHRAFLTASQPIDFTTEIEKVISLFYMIGTRDQVKLGWDPTVERILTGIGKAVQYRFKIGKDVFTTTRPLSTFGADAMVGRSTRVYAATDANGNAVAIKDVWREEDREPEGSILNRILSDIQDKLGEEAAADAGNYFVKIRAYEDVMISGKPDKTTRPTVHDSNTPLYWVKLHISPTLSTARHLPSTGHVPDTDLPTASVPRCHRLHDNNVIPCRVHARTVFEEVGTSLMNVLSLSDSFKCLIGALKALRYMHKAGWVHRDFSITNVLYVKKDDQWVGKLTDVEYAKEVGTELSHDVRTGTMHFMAVEVESQRYLFCPERHQSFSEPLIKKPSFRMNFLHDLESEWWTVMWILFYHTDKESPAEEPEEQLKCFKEAFPGAIGQASRLLFFKDYQTLLGAYEKLSATCRESCTEVFTIRRHLLDSYEKAEKEYPRLVLDDKVLEDIHGKVSLAHEQAVTQLNNAGIILQTLNQLMKKRNRDIDSPTRQTEKKVKRA